MTIPCEICGKPATDGHHLYENYDWRRKLYGKLMDDPSNIQPLCNDCHLVKKKGIKFQTEIEFCRNLGIAPRSKVGR